MDPKYEYLIYWIGRGFQAIGTAMLLYQVTGIYWDAVMVGLTLVVAGSLMVGGSRVE
jgi:hypothetical protein